MECADPYRKEDREKPLPEEHRRDERNDDRRVDHHEDGDQDGENALQHEGPEEVIREAFALFNVYVIHGVCSLVDNLCALDLNSPAPCERFLLAHAGVSASGQVACSLL